MIISSTLKTAGISYGVTILALVKYDRTAPRRSMSLGSFKFPIAIGSETPFPA